jgi:hypothetical protein
MKYEKLPGLPFNTTEKYAQLLKKSCFIQLLEIIKYLLLIR